MVYCGLTGALTVWDVHTWIKTKDPDVVFVRDVADEFNISPEDAAHRMANLRKWGLLNYQDRKQKARGGYILTEYGRKFVWKEKEKKKK